MPVYPGCRGQQFGASTLQPTNGKGRYFHGPAIIGDDVPTPQRRLNVQSLNAVDCSKAMVVSASLLRTSSRVIIRDTEVMISKSIAMGDPAVVRGDLHGMLCSSRTFRATLKHSKACGTPQ